MNKIDLCIAGFAAVGLLIWIRGCARKTISDSILGLVLAVIAAAAYFFVFSLTRTAWLGAMLLGAFVVAALPFPRFLATAGGQTVLIVALLLAAVAGLGEYKYVSAGNALLVIEPYRSGKGGWRFDEPRFHLKGEPFVQGIPEMLDKIVEGIPGSDKAVRLVFSQNPFPQSHRLDRRREDAGGNWYYSEEYKMEGWLCPALFKFFPRAPQHIYVRAEQK